MNAKLLAPPPPAPPHCLVLRITEEGHWNVRLKSLSAHSVELVPARPVKPGTLLTLVLGTPGPARLLRVSQTRLEPSSHQWLLRGAFLKDLGSAELAALRQRAPQPTGFLIRATEEGPWGATLHAVAPRGLELITRQACPARGFLTVELPEDGKWGRERLLRITKVRRICGESSWLVSGVLLSRLSELELRTLSPIGGPLA
jgi:hypothetical protein